jgi:hypothetical protein
MLQEKFALKHHLHAPEHDHWREDRTIEESLKQMPRSYPQSSVKIWLRLRTHMAISYVVVTLVIVLLLEGLVSAAIFYILTR